VRRTTVHDPFFRPGEALAAKRKSARPLALSLRAWGPAPASDRRL